MNSKSITRREFLKSGSAAAIAGGLFLSLPRSGLPGTEKKSRVVLIRHSEVIDQKYNIREKVLNDMLDEAVTTLLEGENPQQAWKQLIQPNDIVGIKSNVWHYLPTPKELENSIRIRIMEAGVKADNMGIGDRGILRDSVFQNATALINVRPMRTHYWSGVGSLIKNYIMFVKRPSDYHNDVCADLATIWKLPLVKDKTRLNILVMLTPLFHSVGPHNYNPEYVWPYCGLLVGFDPVAVDSTGVRIIQAKRNEFFREDRPLNPPPKHIFLADTRHHLGTANPNRIELIKLGWEKGTLI